MSDRTPITSLYIRYAIALTYNCNSACKYCNRFLDIFTWKDTDITLQDLELGWEAMKASGINLEKVRITGGEPLLHPNFEEYIKFIRDTWKNRSERKMPIFTNGTIERPFIEKCKYRIEPLSPEKIECHTAPMISPLDLGLEPTRGFVSGAENTYCHRQRSCGRLFDCHGFTFCIFAGAIGRLLGVDPYTPYPELDGRIEICGHCPFSLGVPKCFRLAKQVRDGKLEYPTKTYREAIQKVKDEGHFKLKKFQERL